MRLKMSGPNRRYQHPSALTTTTLLVKGPVMATADSIACVPVGTRTALIDSADLPLMSGYTWYYCHGYARADVWFDGEKTRIYMHRLILGTSLHVDHKNGDGLDNRRENLRPATRSQNLQNRRGATRQSSTRIRGVYVDKRDGRIYARCVIGGKAVNLGRFPTLEAAAEAVRAARARLMTHAEAALGVHCEWGVEPPQKPVPEEEDEPTLFDLCQSCEAKHEKEKQQGAAAAV